jgi:broad specificity phosphatase PhoE
MQISLVRHGKPDVDFSRGDASRLDWVETYDLAGIDPSLPPPAGVRDLAEESEYALSSNIRRAVESLGALTREGPAPVDSLFREIGLRGLPASPFHLNPDVRATLAHLGWRFAWFHVKENPIELHRRARAASAKLASLAATHETVLLVGHGFFNTFIAWHLLLTGWSGPIWPTGSYWSSAVYRKGSG